MGPEETEKSIEEIVGMIKQGDLSLAPKLYEQTKGIICYPAHELLEGYAVTLYDLDVSRERQLRAATSSTEQANRARNAGRLQILEEKERDLREKAEALILKCQTPDEREMLRMRYLMLMDWATIARVLYGDEPDFYDGKAYRHRALCLHQNTMIWLEKELRTEEEREDENT